MANSTIKQPRLKAIEKYLAPNSDSIQTASASNFYSPTVRALFINIAFSIVKTNQPSILYVLPNDINITRGKLFLDIHNPSETIYEVTINNENKLVCNNGGLIEGDYHLFGVLFE